MPRYALAMVLGALLAFFGNRLPDPFWSAYLPLLLLFAYFNPAYRFVLLLFAATLWSSAVMHHQLSHRLHAEFDHREVLLSGTIADIPQVRGEYQRLLLEDLKIEGYPAPLPRRVRLNWYQLRQVPHAGERWQLRARLRQPRGLLNPAGFDFERWQFVEGIDAAGYVIDARDNRRLQAAASLSLQNWRGRLVDRIERDCADCRQPGLIKALALGVRGDIEPRARELLRDSGTAHLLAISGLHIGVVAMLFYALGRFAWRLGGYRSGINRGELASLCGLSAALLYAALAGFSLPTLRALLMLAVVLLGMQFRRRIDLLQSLSLALLLILVIDPLAVGSGSFWLSFAALLVISFNAFRQPGPSRKWARLLVLQCYFAILFAPVLLLMFGQFNPASLPANLVAIPAVSLLILPAVLCASLLSALDLGAATLVFALADQGIVWLLGLLEWLLSTGLEPVSLAYYSTPLIMLSLLALGLLLLPRWSGLPVAAAAMLAALALWQPRALEFGEYELTILDVGMGSSALLRTRHHSLVYDFGPGRGQGYNSAELGLLPLIRQRGIGAPDLLVVSHVDQDHSGGLHAFVADYQPTRLLSGTPAELRQRFGLRHRVRSCHEHPDWSWDGVRFRFLKADPGTARSSNNRSCVLQILGHHSALLPGDIEAAQESRLLHRYGDGLAADILMAPHHGSHTSSSQEFIERVNPAQVVFTLARNNRWRFPDPRVLARYRGHAARRWRSDHDGAVVFTSRRGELSIEAMREPVRRIWRRW